MLFILANILNMARSLLLFDNLPLKAFTGQIYMSIMVMVLAKDRIGRKLVVYTSYTISTLLAEITGAFIAKYVYGHNLEQNLEFSFECFLWQGTVFFLIFVYTTVSLLFIKKKKINMDTEITKLVYLYVFLQSYVVFSVSGIGHKIRRYLVGYIFDADFCDACIGGGGILYLQSDKNYRKEKC